MSGSRNIFEEVSAPAAKPVTPGAAEATRRTGRARIALWQIILFVLVAIMIIVGGLTRLTDSGLSITEWAPVMGAIPPLSDADWMVAFDRYKATDEFRLVNSQMDLDAFKVIFWWEWGHRFLGRFIGLVWAIGMIGFLVTKTIPAGWFWRLAIPGLLGGVQGAIGWWMVASGLEGGMVDVASYRLATHLGLAFVILGLLGWNILLLRRDEVSLLQARRRRANAAQLWSGIMLAVIFAQILMGALVAGIDAGRGYIDWPLMGGEVVPSEILDLTPLWSNFFENPATVQFNHRLLGYAVLILSLIAYWRSRQMPHQGIRRGFALVAAMTLVQSVIGIVTVLHASPLEIAIFHQGGAIVLFALAVAARFETSYPGDEKIARG